MCVCACVSVTVCACVGKCMVGMCVVHVNMCTYIYIWVILLKTGQNCDKEGKNSV